MMAERHYSECGPHGPPGRRTSLTPILPSIVGIMYWLLVGLVALPSIAPAQSRRENAALAETRHLNSEAITLYKAGKFSQAEPLFQRALTIREQALGPTHPDVAPIFHIIGLARLLQGKSEGEIVDIPP
jgi:hypothetical protein